MAKNKGRAPEDALAALHGEMADALAAAIKEIRQTAKEGGELKGAAAILNVARQFLKDNGIESLPEADKGLQSLMDELPFQGEDDTPAYYN